MIKFFRNIRRKYLAESRFSKYLLYAIGEIILVVIGILIALQINNWNELRKQKDTLNNIYATIKTDLQEDIKNIDRVISQSEPLEKHYLAIANKTRKKEDFKNCDWCWNVNIGFPEIKLRHNGFDLLLDYNKLNTTIEDTLSINLKKLYNDLANTIKIDLNELTKDTDDYIATIVNSKLWFTELVKGHYTEEFIEYALTDVAYRNYATMVHFIFFVKYIPDLKEFKAKGLKFIELIDKRLEVD